MNFTLTNENTACKFLKVRSITGVKGKAKRIERMYLISSG